MGRPMHHCGRCGTDLTRSRAVRDPVYGLPLVRCPSCGLTLARRKHPAAMWMRRACRAIPVFFVLLAQAVIIPIVTMGFVGMAALLADEIVMIGWSRDGTLRPGSFDALLDRYAERPEDMGALIGMICIAGLAGVWMGLFMRHWKRWTVFAAWMMFVLGSIGLDVLRVHGSGPRWFFAPLLGEPWSKTPLQGAMWVIVVIASLPIVLALMAFGGAVARALDRRRGARRKKMLVRLRHARAPRSGRTT